MNPPTKRQSLYPRWVGVNALGEMLGLGSTLGLGAWIISQLGNQNTVVGILAAFGVAVASGVIEATVVGLAQWWAMRPWFPAITRRAWWLATLVGALIAYVLGYLPSTLMDLGQQTAQQAPAAEPPQAVVLLLAAGLGLVGGAVLSFAQSLAMRGKVERSGLWIPANMLAWAVGMPIIFWGIDLAQKVQTLPQIILVMALVLLLAGAVVGAIHGLVLIRLKEKTAGKVFSA